MRKGPSAPCFALLVIWLVACWGAIPAYASLTVLLGEPFGSFGTMMPVGHTTIYLDRVCPDGPARVRMCRAGEPSGVALARYDHLGPVDWIASPIMQFLYAADTPATILTDPDGEQLWERRQRYRRDFLDELFPDGTETLKRNNEWVETVGVAFDRRLWGYQVKTTFAQDERFVDAINARPNVHGYHLRRSNCADFAADIVNSYFPGAVARSNGPDLGILSPKQVARSLWTYAGSRPELGLSVFEIPQMPGDMRRSRPVRGGAEALLKTKRYVATLLILQPEAVLALAVLYLDHGRWAPGRNADPVAPVFFERSAVGI